MSRWGCFGMRRPCSLVARFSETLVLTTKLHGVTFRKTDNIFSNKILKQEVQTYRPPNMEHNICGSSIWNLLYLTFLTPRCWRCILGFRKKPPPPTRFKRSIYSTVKQIWSVYFTLGCILSGTIWHLMIRWLINWERFGSDRGLVLVFSWYFIEELKIKNKKSRWLVSWANFEPGTSPTPIPTAAPSKACLRPLAKWGCGFESSRGRGCLVICQVQFSALVWSLVQRSPNECGVSGVIVKPQQWADRTVVKAPIKNN
jgi:hypothetical protein